jgi:hypothetical protein
LLDLYPYATTSAIYIAVADSSLIRKENADHFEAWIDRMIAAAKGFQDWNNAAFKIMNSPRPPVLVMYRLNQLSQ